MKINLEPSKLTRSWTGWLWVVQVVTGNSQEEVMIFCDTHTELHHNIYIIITTIITCGGSLAEEVAGHCIQEGWIGAPAKSNESLSPDQDFWNHYSNYHLMLQL